MDCRASLDIAAAVLLVTGAVGHAEKPVGQRVTPKPRDTYPEELRQVRGASQDRCPGGLWRARWAAAVSDDAALFGWWPYPQPEELRGR